MSQPSRAKSSSDPQPPDLPKTGRPVPMLSHGVTAKFLSLKHYLLFFRLLFLGFFVSPTLRHRLLTACHLFFALTDIAHIGGSQWKNAVGTKLDSEVVSLKRAPALSSQFHTQLCRFATLCLLSAGLFLCSAGMMDFELNCARGNGLRVVADWCRASIELRR